MTDLDNKDHHQRNEMTCSAAATRPASSQTGNISPEKPPFRTWRDCSAFVIAAQTLSVPTVRYLCYRQVCCGVGRPGAPKGSIPIRCQISVIGGVSNRGQMLQSTCRYCMPVSVAISSLMPSRRCRMGRRASLRRSVNSPPSPFSIYHVA